MDDDTTPAGRGGARCVGHEINNLLVPIITLAALIEDAAADEQTRRDARTIQQSARRIAELLDGLPDGPRAAGTPPGETP
jgi:nitrogen-specific signal transduction histidine kinase